MVVKSKMNPSSRRKDLAFPEVLNDYVTGSSTNKVSSSFNAVIAAGVSVSVAYSISTSPADDSRSFRSSIRVRK